jgi:hypothetical protein
MLELGRRWCEVLGLDPKQHAPGRDPQPGRQSPLAEAVRAVLDAVATAGQPAAAIDPDRARERAAERATRRRTDEIAGRVFASSAVADPRLGTPTRRLREPTPAEQAAARRLARALRAAAHRRRVTTAVTSPTPPGRLRMRDVLVADAQRAAGAVPTAEPFTRTLRRGMPTPPLRLGIACDVSRSMSLLARPVASAAWIPARAGAHVPDARSATSPSARASTQSSVRERLPRSYRCSEPGTEPRSSAMPSTPSTPASFCPGPAPPACWSSFRTDASELISAEVDRSASTG